MPLVVQSSLVDTLSKLDDPDKPINTNTISTAVKDTFINRTAIAPQSYPDIYGTLLSYTEGVPVITEYFRKRVPYINRQTGDTSLSLERSAVHTSYDLIHNFEMRIKDQLDIAIDPETTETSISGESIIYPGFNPNPGDIFYFKLPDNQIGVFVVDQVTPLAIHRSTHFLINFHLYSYLDNQIDLKLRESVVDELYFDKQSYFSDEVALLSDTTYNQLQSLLLAQTNICKLILAKFYNKDYKTIMLNDIYDPFIIEFLSHKLSVQSNKVDICPLSNTYIELFDYTIFKTILDHNPINLLLTGYSLFFYKHYLWDTNISHIDKFRLVYPVKADTLIDRFRLVQTKFELDDIEFKTVSYYLSDRFYFALNKSYEDGVEIEDIIPLLSSMIDDPAIFQNLSEQFYCVATNDYRDMTFFDTHDTTTGSNNNMHIPELEYMILHYILSNEVDIEYFVSVLSKFPFAKMSDRDKFFYLPIFLHFIDVIIPRLR